MEEGEVFLILQQVAPLVLVPLQGEAVVEEAPLNGTNKICNISHSNNVEAYRLGAEEGEEEHYHRLHVLGAEGGRHVRN